MSLIFLFFHQQQNLGRRIGASKMHLSPPPPVASTVVRSKAVVLFVLIQCLLLISLFKWVLCWSLFFDEVLGVFSRFAS